MCIFLDVATCAGFRSPFIRSQKTLTDAVGFQLYITRARLTIGVTDRVLSQDEVCCALMNCLCQSPRRSAGLLYRVGFISMLPEVLLFKTSCTFINSWEVCLFVCFPICEQACRSTDQSKLILYESLKIHIHCGRFSLLQLQKLHSMLHRMSSFMACSSVF